MNAEETENFGNMQKSLRVQISFKIEIFTILWTIIYHKSEKINIASMANFKMKSFKLLSQIVYCSKIAFKIFLKVL